MEPGSHKLMQITAQVASAYFEKNRPSSRSVPDLIESVYVALDSLVYPNRSREPPVPAVPVARSIHRDYLICLEDGKQFKTLRRHLKMAYNLTPQAYREKWGLRPDYPMVAPSYASQRSALARSLGLGSRPNSSEQIKSRPKAKEGRASF